jgi:hypothetical protein
MVIKKGAILILTVFCLLAGQRGLAADDSEVLVLLDTPPNSPAISGEMEKGTVAEYTIRIKNAYQTAGKVGLYALVYEVDKNGIYIPYDSSDLDVNAALSKWINFPRSVIELEQGQEVVKELNIRPSPDAKDGDYRAVIVLGRGSTQSGAAETAEKYNEPTININIKIKAHTIERAEVASLGPVTPVLTKSPLQFSLKIKNIGNVPINPKGEVVLYTKNGKELASSNIESSQIAPDETKEFLAKVNYIGSPGRYKVKFLGEYGENNKELQDVIYFLYLPTVILIIIIVFIIGGLAWLANLINKRRFGSNKKEEEKDYVINLRR